MVELETVRNLEAKLNEAKKEIAVTLLSQRQSLKLSLRNAGKKVRLSAMALSNIERGKSFELKTVERIARTYERLAA